MQVLVLMLLLLSDSFAFGLRSVWHYPQEVSMVWLVGSILVMFLPYFRKEKWMDESKWLGSNRDLWQ